MKKNEAPRDMNRTLKIVIGVLSVILLALISVAVVMSNQEPEETTPATEPTSIPTTAPTTVPSETETVPPETEPDPVLDGLREMNEAYPDIDCWIRIGNTIVDHPVAYTPDEPEKYHRKNIDGEYSYYGTLYISKRCSMDPESQNLIIYGHNMNNGKMFSDLDVFDEEEFWKESPVIEFWTVEGKRTYEIMAAFYDRIYYSWEDAFRYYKFVDPETEEEFNEGIQYFKDNALYETGVTAEYGDRLLMLMTCSYHTEHGRFVLVAVEHMDKDVDTTQPTETGAPEA